MINIFKVIRVAVALNKSWCEETCDPLDRADWHERNKSIGQSDVTALVVSKYFGGEIVSDISGDGVWEFWNKIGSWKIDLTRKCWVRNKGYAIQRTWERKDLLKIGDTKERYQLLEKRIRKAMGCCGERVIADFSDLDLPSDN